ncbi:MAG: dihydrodipicolinate synthase family protein [Propioniciclava sp.]
MSSVSLNPRGRRLLVALPTLFAPDGSLDLDSCARVGQLVAHSHADGAFIGGTTGEFLALEPEERLAVFDTQRQALGDKRPIGHVGAGSARQAVALLEGGLALGLTEFAAITPYYLPASAQGTWEYFAALSDAIAGRGRLYAYLFQARTTTMVTPEELSALATLPGVVGVKVSGEDLPTVMGYRQATPADFEVFTGNDADFPQAESHGLDGVVSGVAACFPATFDSMIAALNAGDAQAIATAQADVATAVDLIAGDIGRIKVGVGLHGIGTPAMRMAIDPPGPEVVEAIRTTVAALEEL